MIVHAGHYGTTLDPAQNGTDTRSVNLTLPTGTVGPAQAVFTGRPAGMSFTNGKLSGSIKLLDVHCYVLKKSGSTAVTAGHAQSAQPKGTMRLIPVLKRGSAGGSAFFDTQGRQVRALNGAPDRLRLLMIAR
jgi:hypothetical protein